MYHILLLICALLFVSSVILFLLMMRKKESRLLPLLVFCATICLVSFLYLNGVNHLLEGL